MIHSQKKLAQLIITSCDKFDINTIVISPGSRNAPLTIGFSNQKSMKCLSIVDERCAAFFAMGIAQQKQKPVAIVCTSGSALLNYYPAIAEAFYSKTPLIVISADRPKHLIDIGDGQTIRQENVFENHILFNANLSANDNELDLNSKKVAKAIHTSITNKGPVHINVPFDEPLYNTKKILDSDIELLAKQNYQEITATPTSTNLVIDKETVKFWQESKKKMILVGVHNPNEELQILLDKIAEDPTVLILTETTSNLRNPKFINAIDQLISKLDQTGFENLQPEVLLTFGGFVISKRIKQFLRKYKPKHHWHIDKHTELDTFFALSKFIQTDSVNFISQLPTNFNNKTEDYQERWIVEKKNRLKKHSEFLKNTKYSDLKVFEMIANAIPNKSLLQISNSAVIRYAQLFETKKDIYTFCNRGTSGIDGSTSTAIGASFNSNRQTTLITGDLSFFYDSNALWNNYIPKDFRIIIINNSGGGIFKIIPGPKSTNALPFFEVPHQLTAEHLSKMYSLSYAKAENIQEVSEELKKLYKKSNSAKILEIFTPPQINDVILQEYFNYL